MISNSLTIRVLLYSVLYYTRLAYFYPRNQDAGCVYRFDVWKPSQTTLNDLAKVKQSCKDAGQNAVSTMNYIKAEIYKEIKEIYNSTMLIQKDFLHQRIGVNDVYLQLSDLRDKISYFQQTIKNLNDLTEHDEKSAVYDASNKSKALPINFWKQIKNSIGNLKAEWVLIKRQIQEIRVEGLKMKFSQNELETKQRKLQKSLMKLDNKSLAVTSSVAPYETSTGIKSETQISDRALKKVREEISDFKYENKHLRDEISSIKTIVNIITNKTGRLETELNRINFFILDIKRLKSKNKESNVTTSSGALVTKPQNLPFEDNDTAPTDCSDIYKRGFYASGSFEIRPKGSTSFRVYCEIINGTGWTVLQRRIDGLLDFNKRWLEYKYGFGNVYGEFWIGNERIHKMTVHRKYMLRIDMWDWEGMKAHAQYEHFYIESEKNKYRMHVQGYTGNAGDSLSYHSGMAFSTEDVDNDLHSRHCAVDYKSGWWYNNCYSSNLNGIYRIGWYNRGRSNFADGIIWYTLKNDDFYSLKAVELKIRPV